MNASCKIAAFGSALFLALPYGSPSAAQITVHDHGGTARIRLSGEIVPADQCRVARMLVEHPNARTIVIDSPGGDAWAGARLARLISWSALDVVVPSNAKAHSAAAVAIMGGARRRVDGDVGFHAPYLRKRTTVASAPESVRRMDRLPAYSSALLNEVRREITAVLAQGGMPSRMIDAVLATGPSALWRPGAATLHRMSSTGRADRDAVHRLADTCRSVDPFLTK